MEQHAFEAYVEALVALVTGGVDFVVIGSFGLKLLLRDSLACEPADCDLVVRSARRDLDAADRLLAGRGWDVRVWGAPLARCPDGGLDIDAIAGKIYARARREALQIDLVYEAPEPGFDWERVACARADISGVPVAALETILAMGEASARGKDRELATRARRLARP